MNATLDLDADGTTDVLRLNGGTRGGTGTLTVTGDNSALGFGILQDAGTTRFAPGSHLTIDESFYLMSPAGGHRLELEGTTTWSAGSISIYDAGVVENSGALTIDGDAGVARGENGGVDGEIAFRNTGGSLELTDTGSIGPWEPLALTGGTLRGAGTVFGDVSNTGGTVDADTLTISGSYVQGAGGTLHADVAAGGADHLEVGFQATLDGTLEVATAAGFEPASSASFRILDTNTGGRIGTFATTTGLQITPGKRYGVFYDEAGASLVVGDGPANITRPSIPAAARPGDPVSCDPGTWAGSPVFAYAWLRDGAPRASGRTYTIAGDDAGHAIVCRVTGTNANGSTDADSNTLTPAVPPTPTPTPTATPEPTPTPSPTPTPVPPPVIGKTVNVSAERGKVLIRRPDGSAVPIDADTQILTGSVVDTRKGAVRLESRGAGGRLSTGVFYDGVFKITQTLGKRPVTVLSLVEKLDCPKGGKANAAGRKKKKRKRRLWGDAKGDYRTRGRHGSAVNSGTKWMVEDHCDSTLFRVDRGTYPRHQDRLAQERQGPATSTWSGRRP